MRQLPELVLGMTGYWFVVDGRRPTAERVVVVIGAGIAGLVAARLLHDSGLQAVTVLEARASAPAAASGPTIRIGAPVDLGGSWVHGVEGNPLTLWCNKLGINLDRARKPTGC